MRFTLAYIAALASSAAAFMVNGPVTGDQVAIQAGTMVTWSAVDTDQPTFDLWLVNMRHFAPYARQIGQGINRDAQTYRVQGVSGVPPNTGYQFNFVRHGADANEAKERPLAQSGDFTVYSEGTV
ncbi:hypothetical protein AFLA70_171g002260 [Aspergillus flavus AF70]|nr:hypothetical protein AFLA70_171g002260 [Aspergillus flavus AF70]